MGNSLGQSIKTQQQWIRLRPRLRKLYQVWHLGKQSALKNALANMQEKGTEQEPIDINQKEEIK